MAINRKIVNYLPLFIQDYREIAVIMDTEQVEIDRLWSSIDDVFADQFILEATVGIYVEDFTQRHRHP